MRLSGWGYEVATLARSVNQVLRSADGAMRLPPLHAVWNKYKGRDTIKGGAMRLPTFQAVRMEHVQRQEK